MTKFLLPVLFYTCIMGYNFKNARNRKSISKIPKWPSLKPLALKSKFVQKFEFSEKKRTSVENVAGMQGLALQHLFPYKSS